MHVIGKPAAQVALFVFFIYSLLLLFSTSPAFAIRDDESRGRDIADFKKERVCERLRELHSRLPRLVPLPKFCKDIPPPPPDPVTVDLSATPGSIAIGASTTLSWTTNAATSCTASNGWSGPKALQGSEKQSPTTDTTYTLTCGNGTSTSSDAVTVLVILPPQPTVALDANPDTIVEGATSTLSWTTTNATTCTASDGWTGFKNLNSSEIVAPVTTASYTLTCGNGHSTTSDTTNITVTPLPPPTPLVEISASPTYIIEGDPSTLTWISENATHCEASGGWSGLKAIDGNEIVNPATSTTYTLSCGNGTSTSTDSTTVTTSPAPVVSVTLSVTDDSIEEGENTTLNWSSTNATTCEASVGWSGAKSISGSEIVSPTETTTYSITCSNGVSTSTDSESITVTPQPPPPPTAEITAESETINYEESTNLNWSSTNATLCEASGGWSGVISLNGTLEISPVVNTTYTISCGNGFSTTSDSVTVTVILPPTPVITLGADPDTIEEGDVTNVEWTTTNAETCVASGSWSGSKSVHGFEEVSPMTTSDYTLTCTGPGGQDQATTTVTVVPPQLNHLIISEVYYDPDVAHGADPANEWVEIYNPTNATVGLAGWSIKDGSSTDFLPSININAHGFIIVTASSTTSGLWSFPAGVSIINLGGLIGNGLANNGDALFLINAASTTVDAMSYGTVVTGFDPAAPDVADGHSLSRTSLTADTDTAGDWQDTEVPTPGN